MHPTNPDVAFTLINTNPPRSRQKKTASRQGYAVKWNAKTWTFEKSRKIGDKGVTCFDISPDGRYLGFGSSDLSIGMVDASTLAVCTPGPWQHALSADRASQPCATILKAHEFPPTVIKFNPSSTLLVSGSADNSIRIVSIPESTGGSGKYHLLSMDRPLLSLAFRIALSVPSRCDHRHSGFPGANVPQVRQPLVHIPTLRFLSLLLYTCICRLMYMKRKRKHVLSQSISRSRLPPPASA